MRNSIILFITICVLCEAMCWAQIPGGQSAGASMRRFKQDRKQEMLEKRVQTDRLKPPSIDEVEMDGLPQQREEVDVKEIRIQFIRTIGTFTRWRMRRKLKTVTKEYEWKKLTVNDLEELVRKLNEICNDKDMQAYVPQHDVKYGVLFINVLKVRDEA